MKTSLAIFLLLLIGGCHLPETKNETVVFQGTYTGKNILGVEYHLTLENEEGSVTGSMSDVEGKENWVISGMVSGNRMSGKMSDGAIYTFDLEAEIVPGDIIKFNPKNDFGMGDVNFKKDN